MEVLCEFTYAQSKCIKAICNDDVTRYVFWKWMDYICIDLKSMTYSTKLVLWPRRKPVSSAKTMCFVAMEN